MSESYDVLFIGGGPGGYEGAIRAGQLGLKTGCIEKRGTLGGTCLNVGCIPSKALLHASELFEEAGHAEKLGIIAKPTLDLGAMMKHKSDTVDSLTKGIEFLFKKNKVDYIKGAGRILAAGQVEVTAPDGGKQIVTAKNIVISTGSDVAGLPGVTIDEKQVVSSTGAIALDKVPGHLVVIGGGVIGLELGSVWRRLGAKVTVVEFLDAILPGMDGEVRKTAERIFKKQGFDIKTATKVTGVKAAKSGVTVTVEPAKGGAAEEIKADVVLVAIGRKPYTEHLGLAEAGVALDERGRVKTDSHFATNVPGIYAIGDVIAGPMLAHKASEEGVVLAELLAGQKPHINYDAIPGVVYTFPEIAVIGKTEEELKAAGIEYKAGKFPLTANSRAKANNATEGFIKILADAKTDRVLGAHLIGAGVGEMVGEIGVALEFGASSEDIARTCHAHPTVSEAIKQAAAAVTGMATQF